MSCVCMWCSFSRFHSVIYRHCGGMGTISREKITIKRVIIIIPLFVHVLPQRSGLLRKQAGVVNTV